MINKLQLDIPLQSQLIKSNDHKTSINPTITTITTNTTITTANNNNQQDNVKMNYESLRVNYDQMNGYVDNNHEVLQHQQDPNPFITNSISLKQSTLEENLYIASLDMIKPIKQWTYYTNYRKYISSPIKTIKGKKQHEIKYWDDSEYNFVYDKNNQNHNYHHNHNPSKSFRKASEDEDDPQAYNNNTISHNKAGTNPKFHIFSPGSTLHPSRINRPLQKLIKNVAMIKNFSKLSKTEADDEGHSKIDVMIPSKDLKPFIRRKSCYCSECGGLSELEKKNIDIVILNEIPTITASSLYGSNKETSKHEELSYIRVNENINIENGGRNRNRASVLDTINRKPSGSKTHKMSNILHSKTDQFSKSRMSMEANKKSKSSISITKTYDEPPITKTESSPKTSDIKLLEKSPSLNELTPQLSHSDKQKLDVDQCRSNQYQSKSGLIPNSSKSMRIHKGDAMIDGGSIIGGGGGIKLNEKELHSVYSNQTCSSRSMLISEGNHSQTQRSKSKSTRENQCFSSSLKLYDIGSTSFKKQHGKMGLNKLEMNPVNCSSTRNKLKSYSLRDDNRNGHCYSLKEDSTPLKNSCTLNWSIPGKWVNRLSLKTTYMPEKPKGLKLKNKSDLNSHILTKHEKSPKERFYTDTGSKTERHTIGRCLSSRKPPTNDKEHYRIKQIRNVYLNKCYYFNIGFNNNTGMMMNSASKSNTTNIHLNESEKKVSTSLSYSLLPSVKIIPKNMLIPKLKGNSVKA